MVAIVLTSFFVLSKQCCYQRLGISTFEPFDEDVIRTETTPNPAPGKIFTIAGLKEQMSRTTVQKDSPWLREGMPCEYLSANAGGGWQTGKLRIQIEFVPDAPDMEAMVLPPGDREGGES